MINITRKKYSLVRQHIQKIDLISYFRFGNNNIFPMNHYECSGMTTNT